MLSRAIVKTPSRTFADGITSASLGKPVYTKALGQHKSYVEALRACGLVVTTLEPDDRFPDSTFVEDAAIMLEDIAVITNPGAPSRSAEAGEMARAVQSLGLELERIVTPGTVDGGDVMRVEDHFYVGLSERTNEEGARQLERIVVARSLRLTTVPLRNMLHLKTGIAYVGRGTVVVTGEFMDHPAFKAFRKIVVQPDEAYAANCIDINGTVLLAEGFPQARRAVEDAGFKVLTVDVSEFRKMDGGLSCLSLRY